MNVNVVIGAGSIGQAIARRVSTGKHVVLADLRQENAEAAAKVMSDAGFDVSTTTVDISSRKSIHAVVETAAAHGAITGLIHAAGVSPTQASPSTILHVDLYGTAVLLEEFGNVIDRGGSGVVTGKVPWLPIIGDHPALSCWPQQVSSFRHAQRIAGTTCASRSAFKSRAALR